jgi:hypothetical protein
VIVKRRLFSAAVVSWVTVGLLFGFVPTCLDEMARAYPPVLRADLSACNDNSTQSFKVARDTQVDPGRFASRLTGTWSLKARTVRGIKVDQADLTTKLYFDVHAGSGTQVSGVALLLEGVESKPSFTASDAQLAAFWNVLMTRSTPGLISVSMNSASRGAHATAKVRNVRRPVSEVNGVFVALGSRNEDGGWDRLMWMPTKLTHVSCTDNVVETYVKVSSSRPTVAGVSLEQAWKDLTATEVAGLSKSIEADLVRF